MSDEYTPTTEWLRIMVGYAMTKATDRTKPVEDARAEGYEWFDRWLTAQAAALEEPAAAISALRAENERLRSILENVEADAKIGMDFKSNRDPEGVVAQASDTLRIIEGWRP